MRVQAGKNAEFFTGGWGLLTQGCMQFMFDFKNYVIKITSQVEL